MNVRSVRLGIDGGGTKTRFLLVDRDDRELADIETGPSNWLSVGKDAARESLAQGIARLPTLPDIACGGFAGAGRPESAQFFSEVLQGLLPHARVAIETDAFIAYIGAIGVGPGVLLIAGTGSIAIGRRPDGTMIRAGGWGSVFGDEGGGFWIGREAVRAALRCADRNEFPEFVSSIERALEVKSISDTVSHWATGRITLANIAALAPEILRQHETEPSRSIVDEAASHLRALTEAAEKKVGVKDCRRSVIGSIGNAAVMQKRIGLEFVPPVHSPQRGAIIWGNTLFHESVEIGS